MILYCHKRHIQLIETMDFDYAIKYSNDNSDSSILLFAINTNNSGNDSNIVNPPQDSENVSCFLRHSVGPTRYWRLCVFLSSGSTSLLPRPRRKKQGETETFGATLSASDATRVASASENHLFFSSRNRYNFASTPARFRIRWWEQLNPFLQEKCASKRFFSIYANVISIAKRKDWC